MKSVANMLFDYAVEKTPAEQVYINIDILKSVTNYSNKKTVQPL